VRAAVARIGGVGCGPSLYAWVAIAASAVVAGLAPGVRGRGVGRGLRPLFYLYPSIFLFLLREWRRSPPAPASPGGRGPLANWPAPPGWSCWP
jgi:hypothetical protein